MIRTAMFVRMLNRSEDITVDIASYFIDSLKRIVRR